MSTNLTRALTSSPHSLLARALKSAIALAIVSCIIAGASTAAVSAAGAATAQEGAAVGPRLCCGSVESQPMRSEKPLDSSARHR